MEYKSKKNLIKAALGFQVNLAQMKLEDGITIVEAEEFAPDYSVGIVTADGIVPMPVGEYTMQDGMVLVVETEGIIQSIVEESQEEQIPEMGHPNAEATEVQPISKIKPVGKPQSSSNPQPVQAKRVVESVSKETFFEEIEKLRTELSAQINEVKAENEALKAENKALEVKLNSQEEGAEPIVQNPEAEVKVQGFAYGQNHPETILDNVFLKIFS
jgi:hypothetical protein